MNFTVIIPTLNEQSILQTAIDKAWAAGAHEVVVCDGGSDDLTKKLALDGGAKLVESKPGRGVQLNMGARSATGDLLVFLHADTWLAAGGLQSLQTLFESNRHVWGGFKQKILNRHPVYRLVEAGNGMRIKYRRLVYGDQGLFVTRQAFDAVGGFPPIPLMEDVEISRRLLNISKPRLAPGPLYLSDRHWQKRGVVRQTIKNWQVFAQHQNGASPWKLAFQYYGQRFPATPDENPSAPQNPLVDAHESADHVNAV